MPISAALPILDTAAIERLIPHKGAMSLLARVVEADGTRIVCEAESHRDPGNPLRLDGRLPAIAGVEYAAQAVAAHAALRGDQGAPPREGALAVLSDVTWREDRLDGVEGPLRVEAELLADTGGGLQYRFAVGPREAEALVAGVLIIALG